jgi:hypothetical protein
MQGNINDNEQMKRFCWYVGLVVLLAACTEDPVTPTSPVPEPPVIAGFTATAAGLEVTFSWQVTPSNLSCKLDVDNNGTPEYTLPCSNTQKHTYLAGNYTAKLSVQNGEKTSEKTVSVQVKAPSSPNGVPVIAQFKATPSSGSAPLNTQLSWQISDPDSDSLVCKIDVNDDGTAEYTVSPCVSAGRSHTYGAGSYVVRLTVEDAKGGSTTTTLPITASAPPNPTGPDARISRVEWGQTIVKENFKLIEGKQALLRIYALADRAGVATGVRAQVWRSGVYQGEVALTGPTTLPTAETPADLTQTFRGTVPANWMAAGLEVRIQIDPSNTLAESDENNNSRTLNPTLMTAANTLYLTAVPVRYTDTLGTTSTTDDVVRTATIPNFSPLLLDVFPLKAVQTTNRATYNFTGNLKNGSDWSRLLGEINTLRLADGKTAGHYYHGFVNTGYSSGIAGIGYVGWPVGVTWNRDVNNNYNNGSAAWVMAHELGHNFARDHAPCGVSNSDPKYPTSAAYAGALLGTYGYSFGNAALGLISPTSRKDLMSYCDPSWISDYSYEGIQQFLEQNPSTATSVVGLSSQSVLLVRGVLRSGHITLQPLTRIQAQPKAQAGPYTLKLRTATGWTEVPFAMHKFEVGHTNSEPEYHFALTLSDPGSITGLEIWQSANQLYARDYSLRAQSLEDPGVKTTETPGQLKITWAPSVFPYLSVAHLGQERTTLTLDHTGGEATLATQGIPAGGSWEIALSDGVNTKRMLVAR